MKRTIDIATWTAALLLLPLVVRGWPAGGVIVAPTSIAAQAEPLVLAGNSGTVFAFWSDGRWMDGRFDLYGQLLTPLGTVAPAWSDTGLMIARAPDDQRTASGLSHPDGSFIVGIYDNRNFFLGGSAPDSYLAHVLPNGMVDPTWPRHGLAVLDRMGGDSPQRMDWVAPDTLVMLTGYIDSDGIARLLFQMVALSSSGPTLPWGAQGVLLDLRPRSAVTTAEMAPDGAGGVFGLLDEDFSTPDAAEGDLYLTRIARDGGFAAGWTTGAKPVSVGPGVQGYASMCADGEGGVYVAWVDGRLGVGLPWPQVTRFEDIRLQRLDPDGAPRAGWPAEGLLVCDAPEGQDQPRLLRDGAGGVYVAWEDVTCINLTRVQGDGTFAPGWARNGIRTGSPGFDVNVRMVPDDFGGAYVLFEDLSVSGLFVQHALPGGVLDPRWPASGYQVSLSPPGDIARDGAGGCYVAFEKQQTPGQPETYIAVARFGVDGPVPVKLAETSAEASYDHVHLVWRGGEATAADSRVQRRSEADASWRDLGAPVTTGQEQLEFDDTTVEPGVRYAYRLVRGGTEVMSNEQWVEVPAAAAFALSGAWPNPALAREAAVRFSLTGSGAARLEVLDLAGRREHVRALGSLGPGRHTLSLAEAQLAPGVHWLRLTEGTREAHARMVVVR